MTRQWVHVTKGKPGRGSIGYIDRFWRHKGQTLTLIRFAVPFPRDLVAKSLGTFELLTEAECLAMEIRP